MVFKKLMVAGKKRFMNLVVTVNFFPMVVAIQELGQGG